VKVELTKTEIWDCAALVRDRAIKSIDVDDYNYWVALSRKLLLVTIHSPKDGVPWRRDDNGWYLCYASPDGLHEPQ